MGNGTMHNILFIIYYKSSNKKCIKFESVNKIKTQQNYYLYYNICKINA